MWKRDIVLDLGQCINFTFISQWMFPGGRLCSFQTPSELPAQCYRGGLWGERGRASDTRQVDCSLPISCSQLFHLSGKPSVKCDPQPLGVIGYEYPVKPVWWKDVNILLMFQLLIHSLTHTQTWWRQGYYMQTAKERNIERWEWGGRSRCRHPRSRDDLTGLRSGMDVTQRWRWEGSFTGPSDDHSQ